MNGLGTGAWRRLPIVGLTILAVILAYLVGSVDFAVLVSRRHGIDIYTVGSGNPGAANVARVLGKRWAAAVLVGDLAKGMLGAGIGTALGGSDTAALAAGLATVIGHCFPLWHRFRGGKGVATSVGVLIWTAPLLGLGLAGLWLAVVFGLGVSSVASLLAVVLSLPGLAALGYRGWSLVWSAAIVTLVVARHRENIRALLAGEERTINTGT